jgi:hypothetical protein
MVLKCRAVEATVGQQSTHNLSKCVLVRRKIEDMNLSTLAHPEL